MTITNHPFFQPLRLLILSSVFSCILITIGCDDNNSTGSVPEGLEGAEVVIEPKQVSFEVDEQQEFSALVISASGNTVNEEFDFEWIWYSSNPDVFTVQNSGTATGKSPGEAYCIVEATSEAGKVTAKLKPFVGRDSAFVSLF